MENCTRRSHYPTLFDTEYHCLFATEGSFEVYDFSPLESLPSCIAPEEWESLEPYQFEMLALSAAAQNLGAIAKPRGSWGEGVSECSNILAYCLDTKHWGWKMIIKLLHWQFSFLTDPVCAFACGFPLMHVCMLTPRDHLAENKYIWCWRPVLPFPQGCCYKHIAAACFPLCLTSAASLCVLCSLTCSVCRDMKAAFDVSQGTRWVIFRNSIKLLLHVSAT